VLFGRLHGEAGSSRAMGMFINTLPVRITLGSDSAESTVRHTHALLADLMHHEHASLALAQRCSAIPAPAPLFSSLLNYRHIESLSREALEASWPGIERLWGRERTNYPLALSVNDMGDRFELAAMAERPVDAARVCALMG